MKQILLVCALFSSQILLAQNPYRKLVQKKLTDDSWNTSTSIRDLRLIQRPYNEVRRAWNETTKSWNVIGEKVRNSFYSREKMVRIEVDFDPQVYPGGGEKSLSTYNYNEEGYITAEIHFTGISWLMKYSNLYTYVFDENGRVTSRLDSIFIPFKGYQTFYNSYKYNSDGRVSAIEITDKDGQRYKIENLEYEKYTDPADPATEDIGKNQALIKNANFFEEVGGNYVPTYTMAGQWEDHVYTVITDSAGSLAAKDMYFFWPEGGFGEKHLEGNLKFGYAFNEYNHVVEDYVEDAEGTYTQLYDHSYEGTNLTQTISKYSLDNGLTYKLKYKIDYLFDNATSNQAPSLEKSFLNVYPCPSNGVVNVEAHSEIEVSVLNAQGEVIQYHENASNYQINIHQKGMYLLKIQEGINSTTRKIIVE